MTNPTPAPEATDAELVAAINRGIELGEFTLVTDELLAQWAADAEAEEAAEKAQTSAPAPSASPIPTVEILDEGGHLAVIVDYGYGRQLSATYPTGRGAQYQEARDRQMAEAQRKAEQRKAEILRPYAGQS
jgi:hypothetical protein